MKFNYRDLYWKKHSQASFSKGVDGMAYTDYHDENRRHHVLNDRDVDEGDGPDDDVDNYLKFDFYRSLDNHVSDPDTFRRGNLGNEKRTGQ